MSFPLFKHFLKQNWKLWAIFVGVLLGYMLILVFIFDQMQEQMGGGDMMGITFDMTSRFGLLISAYWGQIALMFPIVFYIMLANKLVSKNVDNNSMSAYLSSSLSRKKYVTTAAVFFAPSIFMMFFAVFVIGGVTLAAFESYNFWHWTLTCFSVFLSTLFVAAICFFISASFPANKIAFATLIGIPIAFFLINWLGEMPVLDFLKYLTPFGYPVYGYIPVGQNPADPGFVPTFTIEPLWWLINLVFLSVALILFFTSIKIFDKKQLSI